MDRRAVVAGRKCCAARQEVEARPGDEFVVDGYRYRVLDVMPMPFHQWLFEFHRSEGFASWNDCLDGLEATCREIRPVMPVWVHFFARCP